MASESVKLLSQSQQKSSPEAQTASGCHSSNTCVCSLMDPPAMPSSVSLFAQSNNNISSSNSCASVCMLAASSVSENGCSTHLQVPDAGWHSPLPSEHLSQMPSQLTPAISLLKQKHSPVTTSSVVKTSVSQVANDNAKLVSLQQRPAEEAELQTESSEPVEHRMLQRSPPMELYVRSQDK